MAREALELGIYSMALGTESKPESLGDLRTCISLGGGARYCNHLPLEPKISPECEKKKKHVVHFGLFFFFLFLQIRVFGFQVVSELYKKKSLSGTGEGMLA